MDDVVETLWQSVLALQDPQALKQLDLLEKIFSNIVANPTDPKYRRVNRTKVEAKLGEAMLVLPLTGFKDIEGTFVLDATVGSAAQAEYTLSVLQARRKRYREEERSRRTSAVDMLADKSKAKQRQGMGKKSVPTTTPAHAKTPTPTAPTPAEEALSRKKALQLAVVQAQEELGSLRKEIETVSTAVDILSGLADHLDAQKFIKINPPDCDAVTRVCKCHLANRERVLVLLCGIMSGLLKNDDGARYLLKKTYIPRLLECDGALEVLLGLGYEWKETALVMPTHCDLTPTKNTLALIQHKMSVDKAERFEAKQKAIDNMKKDAVNSEAVQMVEAEVMKTKANLSELENEVLASLKAVTGEAIRLEFSIRDWKGKEDLTDQPLGYHAPCVDARGRKWTMYIKRSLVKSKDCIAIYLKCVFPKAGGEVAGGAVVVGLHAAVLHRVSLQECSRPVQEQTDKSHFYEIKEFSPENQVWGWSPFTSTEEMTELGAYDRKEDETTFRMDFWYRDAETTQYIN